MSGFLGWFLVIVLVLAVFNAEKLPALRQMLEDKMKGSLDAAKEGSKTLKQKVEQVKTEIDNRKNAPQAEKEPEENTPEETAEALQFMSSYIKKDESEAAAPVAEAPAETPAEPIAMPAAPEDEADKPIDLEHRD